MGECELYGGWLVQINDVQEYNCLLREGKRLTYGHCHGGCWYWTDGNDLEDLGSWTHAHDGSELSFFAPTIGCDCTDRVCRNGGEALMINIGGDKHFRGNYCDQQAYETQTFICEGIIA